MLKRYCDFFSLYYQWILKLAIGGIYMNYKEGSMWRKWDLHIHTPFSILNNQFGNDFDMYFYNLFRKAIENKIFVIGITDYFSIEGYKKVKEYLEDNDKLKLIFKNELLVDSDYLNKIKMITIMPNIEFRLNNMINIINRQSQSKVQIHVIFSEKVPTDDIESQFLNSLHFLNGQNKTALTKSAVIKYGKEMIESGTCNPNDKNPEYVGYNQISVDLSEVVQVLNNSFKGKYLIVGVEEDITSVSWQNQAGAIRKNYYENCDAVFSSNSKSINWFASDDAIVTIKKRKACIWGSDAHFINDLFTPKENRYCWIKADTTFTGLKAAINSVIERVFVGELPLELSEARLRANYSIKNVYIGKNSGKPLEKIWFNMKDEIQLNPYMITIIGNKGSGKSAIADVISYLGNSYKLGKASFLNDQRFLKPNARYYTDFKASMSFYGNGHSPVEKNHLYNDFSYESPEMVQFLPQKYIEEVCNDLGDEFQEEIDSVIYSYIRPEKKLDSTNLKDLIEKLTKSIKNNIYNKRNELSALNDSIVSLENRNSLAYRYKINNQLTVQNEKLRNHDFNKPKVVEKPSDLENDAYSKLDVQLSAYITEIENSIYKAQGEQTIIYNNLNLISEFEGEVKIAIEGLDSINSKYNEIKKQFEIEDDKKYVSYKVNCDELKKEKDLLSKQYADYLEVLSDQFDKDSITSLIGDVFDYSTIITESNGITSLYAKKYYIESCKAKLQNLTSEKSKKYLQYLFDYNQWLNDRRMILGEIPNTIDGESIKKYKDELDYINQKLHLDLQSLRTKRKQVIIEICGEYEKLRNIYQEIYAPVQEKIDDILDNKEERIEFKVNTSPAKDLPKRIIKFMNQRVSSEFKGINEGYDKVNSYIKETSFDDSSSIVDFVCKMYDETEKTKDLNAFISERSSYYSLLGGLDYLNVNYSLTLGGKNLSELSPGERGIVLLVFYLALSKSNFPLIIDQPEDNLDNQSVYKRLVPCIKSAKKNRQIIVVTHNPNIAVACDSEQIIYTQMNKETYEITYQTGSLENDNIREKVIDILEGTMPAFELRRLKYLDELD